MVSKYGITEHYIFYKYQKNGATEGYCTYCKKHVPIRSPKYNQKGQCNVCGQPITFRFCGKVWKILYKVVQSLSYPEETQDFWFCAPDLFMPERGIKRAAIQIAKLPAMKSKEESSLQMERKFPISFMICSNNGKCVGFRVEVLGIILAVTVNIKEWFIHIPCRICPGMN